ncbi:MAG: transposase [Phycisphaerae bacterium]|nr:transposase [Phycisphaerae bacterium]
MRTSNWLENLDGKIKKRTSVVGLFPSVESVLRLV